MGIAAVQFESMTIGAGRWLAAWVFVAASTLPGLASTLSTVTFKIKAGGTDAFVLKGKRAPLSLDGADAVVVRIDRFGMRIPVSALRRNKQIVTYKDATAGERIRRLRLDLAHGQFTVVGDGWSLQDLPNPLPISIGTATDAECRLARLRNPAARGGKLPTKARKVTRWVLTGGRSGDGPCDAVEPLRSNPVVVTAGVATAVQFDVVAPASDAGSLRLRRLDASGRTVGDPLCTFAPVTDVAGRFTCAATLTEASPGSVTLVAQGTAGGVSISSPGFWLPVLASPTDADVAAVANADQAVGAAWDEVFAAQGNTLAARLALIRRLRTTPGIVHPELSPNGIDVTYRFVTGWIGVLVLNRGIPFTAPATAAATVSTRPVVTAPPPLAAMSLAHTQRDARGRGVFRTCPVEATDICCQAPDRRLPLLGRKVLIWDAGFFKPEYDDANPIQAAFAELPCLEHQVTLIKGPAATVASVNQFVTAETLAISSHGMVDPYNRVLLGTAEPLVLPPTPERFELLTSGLLGIGRTRNENTDEWVTIVAVSDDYMRALGGKFPTNSIVYASYCFSGYLGGASPYLGRGAGAFFGFDWKVSQDYTVGVAQQLFTGLVSRFQRTQEAFEGVDPHIDPRPQEADIPGTKFNQWETIKKPANFILAGSDKIAYVSQPDVMPKTSTLAPGETAQLTASAEGIGTCDMKYHWHTKGDAGTLESPEGLDDFETVNPTVTYTADDDPELVADDVGVEMLSPAGGDGIGASCAEAMVNTTTTTSTTTTTTVPTCGAGVVLDADVTEEIHMSASGDQLDDGQPQNVDQYHYPQTTITVAPTTNDNKPWNLSASGGGAMGQSNGSISYSIAPCSITAQGSFNEQSVGGSANGNATTGMDATLQIRFRVSRRNAYHLSGSVTASGVAKVGGPTVFYARCSGNFPTTDASLEAPTGQPVPFAKDSEAFPNESIEVRCAVKRGGASTDATGDDNGTLSWNFTITFD